MKKHLFAWSVFAWMLLSYLPLFAQDYLLQFIETPAGFDDPDQGYKGNPIIYDGKLYLRYQGNDDNYDLFAWDGTTLTLIPSPSGYDDPYHGYIGNPIIYDGKLYLRYEDNNGNFDLFAWNGTTLTPIPSPMDYEDNGYEGEPIIYDGKLYLRYRHNDFHVDLMAWDGSTLTPIPSPMGYESNGYEGNPMIYDGKLYLRYWHNDFHYDLMAWDGTTLTSIPSPMGYDNSSHGYFANPIVFDGKLYLRYWHNAGQYDLMAWDGSILTPISTPTGYDGSNKGYQGKPIIYNGILYLQYLGNDINSDLFSWDGSTLTSIPSPAGYDMHPFGNGYLGKPIVYDGKLHLGYSDNGRNFDLMIWDGSMFTPIVSPTGYENSLRGYFSSTSVPFISNGKLYLQYRANTGNEDLFVWDGTTLTPIPSPAGYETDGGYAGDPISYNGALYLFYENNDGTGVLAKLLTCDSPGSTVTVTTTNDVVDGDVSSIANLLATPGADGSISLREAISATNNTPGADTILFDPSTNGTPIVLNIGSTNEDANADGDLDITGCAGLTITGNGPAHTIIDGNSTERVFHHLAGNLTISGVTVQNGNANSTSPLTKNGGGMYSDVQDATITLSDCTFDGNESNDEGGAVYFSKNLAEVIITDGLFMNNKAVNYGGAVRVLTRTSILRTVFTANESVSLDGGAIAHQRQLDCTNCVFYNNKANRDGGAIHSVSLLNLINSTLTANMAGDDGGAINNGGSDANIYNSILWNNSPYEILHTVADADATMTIANCILQGGIGAVVAETVMFANPIVVDGGGNKDVDPNFVDANDPDGADDEWRTVDDGLALNGSAPSIDMGDDSYISEMTDITGAARFKGATVDMGAYEFSCPPLTTQAPQAVVVNSTCNDGGCFPLGGSISAPENPCPEGATFQYSTDEVNWSSTPPAYDRFAAMTVYTRCSCDEDNTISSPTNSVMTEPEECDIDQVVWAQLGIDIDGEADGDQSGWSVSVSADGTVVTIGAPKNAGGGNNRGQVRVYRNLGGTWTQVGDDIDGEADGDQSGFSVSLSSDGNVVAIGAPFNAGGGTQRGQVRVYRNMGGAWTQVGDDIDGEANIDGSGISVSLSSDGNIVAIGAPNNAGGGSQRGQVRVYQNIGGVWTQVGDDIDGEADGDRSGRSLSLSSDGNIVAISAPNNAGGGTNRGQVRIYRNMGGVWTQVGDDIDGEADSDFSGTSVSLSSDGSVVAISSRNNAGGGTQRGHVRVYRNTGGIWTQVGDDIDGEANGDQSGTSVSLSADGSVLAIGAPFNAGGGSFRGQVRVYRNMGGVWTQIEADINGEANNDLSGRSVALSADGTVVAIGAIDNAGGGSQRGQVRVYDINCIFCTASLSGNATICPGETATITITANGGSEFFLPAIDIDGDMVADFLNDGFSGSLEIPVAPGSTTTYTLLSVEDGINEKVCEISNPSVTVSVQSLPKLTAQKLAFCADQPVDLTALEDQISAEAGTFQYFKQSAQDRLYIANSSSDNVSVVDVMTNSVIATIPMLGDPTSISVSPSGNWVYVVNNDEDIIGDVSVIDAATNQVATHIYTGARPFAVAVSPLGDRVYVTNSNDNTVSVINANTNTVIQTVNVGGNPLGVSVNPSGDRVYVTNQNDNTVSVMDATTNTVLTTIPVGNAPLGVSVSPSGDRVYVTNQNDNTVSVIDATINTVLTSIPVGNAPVNVSVSPDGARVYVTNVSDNTVSVIDAATNMVTTAISVGNNPIGISINTSGDQVYVTNAADGTVSVIDANTNLVIATIPVGTNPISFGNFFAQAPMLIDMPATYQAQDGEDVLVNFTSDATGCFTQTTVTLYEQAIPTAAVSAGPSPICFLENAVFHLTGTPNAEVTYSINGGNDQMTTLNASGEATVKVNGATIDQTLNLVSVSSDICSQNLMGSATVTVNPLPTVSVSAGTTPICAGQDAVFNLIGTPNAKVTYHFNNSGDVQITTLNASGEATVVINGVTTNQTLKLLGIGLNGCNRKLIGSANATVKVNKVEGGTIGIDQTLCSDSDNDPAAFTSETAGSGDGDITYRWEKSTTACDANDFVVIDGATDATYDAPNVTQTTYFRRVTISTLNDVACEAISNCVTITVNQINPGEIGGGQTVCITKDPAAFTSLAPAVGTDIQYQWESSTTNCDTGFTPIDGANAATFDPAKGQFKVTTYFRRRAIATLNEVQCEAVSNCITLTVLNVDCGGFPWNGN